jgi:hypothetical protein
LVLLLLPRLPSSRNTEFDGRWPPGYLPVVDVNYRGDAGALLAEMEAELLSGARSLCSADCYLRHAAATTRCKARPVACVSKELGNRPMTAKGLRDGGSPAQERLFPSTRLRLSRREALGVHGEAWPLISSCTAHHRLLAMRACCKRGWSLAAGDSTLPPAPCLPAYLARSIVDTAGTSAR